MKFLEKLLIAKPPKERGNFKEYIQALESGEFKDRIVFGVAEDLRDWKKVNPLDSPGALYCGGMGSGKSIAMRFTINTLLASSSENHFLIMMDVSKGMGDYTIFFDDKFKPNIAKALNDTQKIVPAFEMPYNEILKRKKVFEEVGAANVDEYEAIMKRRDKNFPGLARIVICVEEFHAITSAKELNFHHNVDREGSVAFMLKQIMRVGRSYGVSMLLATQRATSEDIPSTLKTGINQMFAFKLNNPGDATFMNLYGADLIRSNQKGRCVYEGGQMQYPFIDKDNSIELMNRYYKPLKAKMLAYTPEDYHKALESEGNEGLIAISSFKKVLDNIKQFKVEDVMAKFLRVFDFKITKQTNPAYIAQLIAERNDKKYAVFIGDKESQVNFNSEKTMQALKEGAKRLECSSIIFLTFDNMVSSNPKALVDKMNGYALDKEDIYRIASVMDSKDQLITEGSFDELFSALPLIEKTEVPEEVVEEDDEEAQEEKEAPKRLQVTSGSDDALSSLRERMRAHMNKK